MADGGWDYYYGRCVKTSNFNDASLEVFIDDVSAVITAMPNWAIKTGRTKYMNNGWFITYNNSVTLAELALIFVRDSNGNFIDSSNNVTGTTLNSYYYEYSTWVAYCPPGSQFALTNPNTAGFVPAQGFLFSRMDTYNEWDNPGYHWLHCLVRDDDDLILMWEFDGNENSVIDRLSIMGGCALPVHATDTGALKNEAMIVNPRGKNFNTPDEAGGSNGVQCQFFKADGTTRLVALNPVEVPGWEISYSPNQYHLDGDWPWLRGLLYKSGDPTTEGVVVGNGIKGYLNPEWYRWVQGDGPFTSKTQLNGGNFIFIQNWAAVGWDPLNGDMW